MKNQKLKIIPLGGCYEIGKNCTVFEFEDEIIIIDCGVTFPNGKQRSYGIDLILPDFSYLLKHASKIKAVLLTHGHEDHIGALAYFLEYVQVPVYGIQFTLELLKNRLNELKLKHTIDLNYVDYGDIFRVSENFSFEFIKTTHSIVDSAAILMNTPIGRVLHTGDFKIDYTPMDNQKFDFYRFARLGQEGLLLLLSDSTNALISGYSDSEKSVTYHLRKIFNEAKESIFVSTFASHIHRIQSFFSLAKELGRHVVLSGRSMESNVKLSISKGYLKTHGVNFVDVKKVKNYPRNKLLIITTGTQGEPMSVLSQLSQKKYATLKIRKDDIVVISARVIPGNEKEVRSIINQFFEFGAKVMYEPMNETHVSGHAYREELKLMISLTKPKFFLPLHGEYQHLLAHKQLAIDLGIPEENSYVMTNGDVIALTAHKMKCLEKMVLKEIFVSNEYGIKHFNLLINDRKSLANYGIIIVNLVRAKDKNFSKTNQCQIFSKGLVLKNKLLDFNTKIKKLVLQTLKDMEDSKFDKKKDFLIEVEKNIKSKLRKFLNKNMKRKSPIMLVNFI